MSSATDHLSTALADRYRIERELGEGGMAISCQLSAVSFQLEVAISDRPAEPRLLAAKTRAGDEL